jgi:hypothetical protein
MRLHSVAAASKTTSYTAAASMMSTGKATAPQEVLIFAPARPLPPKSVTSLLTCPRPLKSEAEIL